MSSRTRPPPASRARHRTSRPGRARWVRLGAALAAAWVFVVACYLLQIAWLVPPVVVLVAAALVRVGRSLLDRLVLAAVLLYAALCAGGLVLSVWPWHLHPVAVGGTTLSGLIALAHVTRRRLWLPRLTFGDALSLAVGAVASLVVAYPLLGRGHETRLAILMVGEDGVRHSTMVEGIRAIGGYLFLQPDQAVAYLYRGMVHYPQGSHLLFAVLEGFARSSATDPGTSLSALDHYLAYAVASFAVCGLALAWAVQRLAEPVLTPARRLVLVAVVMAFLLSNQTFVLAIFGYTPQLLGLALVAVLVAVLARPPARTVPALWLVAALLVAVGWTYYLYLPPVVLVVAVWLISRRRVVRHHGIALAGVLSAGAVATVPAVLGLTVGGHEGALLVPSPPQSRDGALVALVLAAAGLLVSWRIPRWRVFAWALGSAVLGLFALTVAQRALRGPGGYYYANKVLDLVLALCILATAALLTLLPTPPGSPRATAGPSTARPRWPAVRRTTAAVAVGIALAAASGLFVGDSPYQTGGSVIARGWVAGAYDHHRYAAKTALAELGRPVPPGTVTLVMREQAVQAYLTQVLLSAVLRQSGPTGPAIYPGELDRPDRYDRMVRALAGHRILIVVDTEQTRLAAEQLRGRHPELDITIAPALG